MTVSENNNVDFGELLARRRAARLGQLAKGQPEEFWVTLGTKLDNSGDGTITMDDFLEALRACPWPSSRNI